MNQQKQGEKGGGVGSRRRRGKREEKSQVKYRRKKLWAQREGSQKKKKIETSAPHDQEENAKRGHRCISGPTRNSNGIKRKR